MARIHDMWFLDTVGNYLLKTDGCFLERIGAPNPISEIQGAVDIFHGKSAAIIRRLLRGGSRLWTQTELALKSKVSSGQCSKVVNSLVNEKLCRREGGKLRLVDHHGLLERMTNSLAGDRQRKRRQQPYRHLRRRIGM